jgi:hypothetical protein
MFYHTRCKLVSAVPPSLTTPFVVSYFLLSKSECMLPSIGNSELSYNSIISTTKEVHELRNQFEMIAEMDALEHFNNKNDHVVQPVYFLITF